MRLDDPEIAEEQSGRFGFHRPAANGVQGQLAGQKFVLGDGSERVNDFDTPGFENLSSCPDPRPVLLGDEEGDRRLCRVRPDERRDGFAGAPGERT